MSRWILFTLATGCLPIRSPLTSDVQPEGARSAAGGDVAFPEEMTSWGWSPLVDTFGYDPAAARQLYGHDLQFVNLDPSGFPETASGRAAVRALGWLISHPVDDLELPIWARLTIEPQLGPVPDRLALYGMIPSPYRAQFAAPVTVPTTRGAEVEVELSLSLANTINTFDEGEHGERIYTSSNCMTCHAGVYGDQVVLGAPNKNLNLEPTFQLFDELTLLRRMADTNEALARGVARLAFGAAMVPQGSWSGLGLDISDPELDVLRASSLAYENHIRPLLNPDANRVVGASAISFAGPYMVACSLEPGGETLDTWQLEGDAPGPLFERMRSIMQAAPDGAVPVSNPNPWWVARYSGTHFTWHATKYGADRSAPDLTVFTSAVPNYGNHHTPSYFDRLQRHHDIMTLIDEIESPPYPRSVDWALAGDGLSVYADNCESCHGVLTVHEGAPWGPDARLTLTYDEAASRVSHDRSRTDAAYTQLAMDLEFCIENMRTNQQLQQSGIFADLPEPEGRVFVGAPPLIGVWASAPYLHNQSVPTVRQLLDSRTRPDIWRLDADPYAYDYEDLGVSHEPLAETPAEERSDPLDWYVYDTRTPSTGASNRGHRYGDRLTDAERDAVIELLKVLGTHNVEPDPVHLPWEQASAPESTGFGVE
ncbi:MAG TPA: hypothetical protein ENK18_22145 [Deltaproteobacteria bacterium]|nr:hypothetical protein [Deltaproteobacteria bacterium]